jgi:hypothetical protein
MRGNENAGVPVRQEDDLAKSGRGLLEGFRGTVGTYINTFMAKAEPAPQPSASIRPTVCVRIGVKYLREQLGTDSPFWVIRV